MIYETDCDRVGVFEGLVSPLETIRVPVVCMIGASKSIEHLPINDWREIRAIANARSFDRFCAAHISGDSLSEEGIFDGDFVIVRITFDSYEIKPGRLVAVLTPAGLLVKHIYQTLDCKVRLVSSNSSYADLLFDAETVAVQGVVVRVERDI